MLLLANWLRIFIDFPKHWCTTIVFNCFLKAKEELQTAVLSMGAMGSFSKSPWGVYTDFQEALEKLLQFLCGLRTAFSHYSKRV
jgi:hypothetical protein